MPIAFHRIHRLAITAVLSAMAAGIPVVMADDVRVYRWTDQAGVSHYGDAVPPEFATSGHVVLNSQGVEVERVAGARTQEEIDAAIRQRALEDQAQRERDEAVLRDKVLLSTYLTVTEIESLRDQRLEMQRAQMQVTQRYLDNLRQKMTRLEQEAQRYSPYNINPDAKPIDEKLARELSETLQSIILYERTLARAREEQQQLQDKFAADIKRFSELRGLSQNR